MATLLLIVIYIGFIGLGVPDSIFGTAWPILRRDFMLPVSFSSFISVTNCACSIVSSLNSSRIIRKLGTGITASLSTLLTAVGLLGFAFTKHPAFFFLFCVPLGLGAGAIDTGLNSYVAIHYSARQMSFLHGFYGVGVTLSPLLLSVTLRDGNWRAGYLTACVVQVAIAAILAAALPLWKRFGDGSAREKRPNDTPPAELTLRETIAIPGVKSVIMSFICSVSLESLCTSWGATYLVDWKGLSGDRAAFAVTFYYVGLTCGRLLSGIISDVLDSRKILQIGRYVIALSVTSIAISLADFSAAGVLAAVGMFLNGFGNGPTYPNLVYLTPRSFGAERAPAIIGAQNAAVYIGIMGLPLLFGLLVQIIGAWLYPVFMVIAFGGYLASYATHLKAIRAEGRE